MEISPALLFSENRKAGSKVPSRQLIELVLELNRRNPSFGCPKIAEQISKTFAQPVDKDVVRRILAAHDQPGRTGCTHCCLSLAT
ncbi:MAG: hypothetical protein ABI618_06475 [Nitrospirota bacterium]